MIGLDHQLMAMVALDFALDEVGVKLPCDLPIEPFQLVCVKAILAAADGILPQGRALFLVCGGIIVGSQPLQSGDLLLDLRQVIVAGADDPQVEPLKLEEIGLELGEKWLALRDIGFQRRELLASLRHDVGFEFLMKDELRGLHGEETPLRGGAVHSSARKVRTSSRVAYS